MYIVYILYSQTLDRYYVGYTNDLCRRLAEHNRKKGKFTDRGQPWDVVYSEVFATKSEAGSARAIKRQKSPGIHQGTGSNGNRRQVGIPRCGRVLGRAWTSVQSRSRGTQLDHEEGGRKNGLLFSYVHSVYTI
ncbi:MAG: GIY-YIG nuclease family protein [Bacteroidales bacterium]